MRRREVPLRGVICLVILLSSALLAHALACGTFIRPDRFIAELFLLSVLTYLASKRELEGPRLALLVLLTQSAVHILLGGMSMNTSSMLISHLACGFVSYGAIAYGEKFWFGFRGYVSSIISLPFSLHYAERFISSKNFFNYNALFSQWIARRAWALRAPPIATNRRDLQLA
jgi:hypothetical protein